MPPKKTKKKTEKRSEPDLNKEKDGLEKVKHSRAESNNSDDQELEEYRQPKRSRIKSSVAKISREHILGRPSTGKTHTGSASSSVQ